MFAKQLYCISVHFGLWIRHDRRFAAPDTLEQGWANYTAGFHCSAGAKYGDVLVEPGVLRKTYNGSALILSQYDAFGFARTGHFQYCAHFLFAHPACCSVGAPLAAGKIAGVPIPAAKPVLQAKKSVSGRSQNDYKQVILQAGESNSLCPAVQYAGFDRKHSRLSCHAPIRHPLHIVEMHLADQAA